MKKIILICWLLLKEIPLKLRKILTVELLIILGIQVNSYGQGKTDGMIRIGEAVTINSKILHDSRKILIHLPEGYSSVAKKYPVLYVLDGKEYFVPAIGIMKYLAMYDYLPEMIVVGIPHGLRVRECTPTKTKRYPAGGGADDFLKFMKMELIPFIDSNYRTERFRVFSGHSLAGLLVLYTFIKAPEMFDAFIAISSTVNWDDCLVQKEAERVLKETSIQKKSLYFSVEGGEDTQTTTNADFAEFLKRRAIKGLNWKFDLMKSESHTSLWIKSFDEGLHFVSPWNLSEEVLSGGIKSILKHFADLKMDISENLLFKYAFEFQKKKNSTEAVEIGKYLIANNPKSADLYHGLGDIYRENGQHELALETYKKGLNLAEGNSERDLVELFKEHIEELKKRMLKKE